MIERTRLTFAQAEVALAALQPAPRLIAIDGLPLSGKSTLSSRLSDRFGWSVLQFDDFYLPAEGWPPGIQPAFPFRFFRLDEFREAVRSLRVHERCSWRPIDWPSLTVQSEPRHVSLERPVVVEGCSVLDPALAGLYDVRLFVESDRDTLVEAQKARDGDNVLTGDWASLFVPSVDIYMRTRPRQRADFIVAGRGCRGPD